jgi:hypothetical protein
MKKLFVINKGKKYIVNILTNDEINAWMDGPWTESSGSENIPIVNIRITEDENIRITEDDVLRILET